MALTEAFAGSASIGTTEYSAPANANYASGSPQTDDGVYQVFLDVSDMVTGDELQIRVYEAVQSTGTQRIVFQANLVGPQSSPIWVSPPLALMHKWDVTLDCIAGTTITVEWSIRKA